MAKYELIESDRPGLFRVRALMNFSNVAVGDIGGYVEGEHNLSQNDTAWVYDSAAVRGHAVVRDRAAVRGNAEVCGHAEVRGQVLVCDQAAVCGLVLVCDQAVVRDRAVVSGHVVVRDHAEVSGQAEVSDQAEICDHALVCDQAEVSDRAAVRGHAVVSGHAVVWGQAVVTETTDLLVVGPIGTRNAYMTICIPAGTVTTGCFHGSVDEFEAAVTANPTGREDYIAIIPAIRVIIANRTLRGELAGTGYQVEEVA